MKLKQIRLLVKDFKKSAAFYRDVLEFPIGWYLEDVEYALFDTGETKLEMLSRKAMAEVIDEGNKPAEADTPSNFLLDFEVEDIDAVFRRLREKGIVFVTEPHDRLDWNSRVAHFRDPEGNLIEIYKHPL